MARNVRRWIPAGAAIVLIAGAATVTSQAGAADLPEKSPEEVLTLLAEHDVEAFSGTFTTSADLGLSLPSDFDLGPHGPDLDDTGATPSEDGTSADALAGLELLTGTHTGRVYVGGPDQARFQHLDGMNERNVIVSGDEVWTYDSQTNKATHLLLPGPSEAPEHPEPDGPLPTPDELAEAAVDALEPTTDLTVGPTEQVAGRDAYTLDLLPQAPESLVQQVSITVDGETGFPLGLTVTAQGQTEPAFTAAYTEIDFDAPDPALFDFTPPAGAQVEEKSFDGPHAGPPGTHEEPEAEVIGESWSSVLVAPAGDLGTGAEALLDQLADPVADGRMVSTVLVSVLVTDDGRVLAGAVTPEHLLSLAGQ